MHCRVLCLLALLAGASCSDAAALFSRSEIQYQRGTLDAPGFTGGGEARTDLFTFQHARAWQHVQLFAFMDVVDDDRRDGFNDDDLYGELYLGGGLGHLFGGGAGFGPLKDIGWVAGLNAGKNAKVRKLLPGLRLYWNAPGFAFLNTDITGYLDENRGVARGGAPSESDSYMVDVSWLRPFSVGMQDFVFTGHAEYIGSRRNQFGGKVAHWILAQPQLRWDAGKALWGRGGQFLLGIEYQYWQNKLGDPGTDERAAQLLLVFGH